MLCKHLEIDVGQLKPAIYLKDPERIRKIEYQLSQPIKKEQNMSAHGNQSTNMAEPELVNIIPDRNSSSPVNLLVCS